MRACRYIDGVLTECPYEGVTRWERDGDYARAYHGHLVVRHQPFRRDGSTPSLGELAPDTVLYLPEGEQPTAQHASDIDAVSRGDKPKPVKPIWSSGNPPDHWGIRHALRSVAEGARPAHWFVSREFGDYLRMALTHTAHEAWDGWGGEEARRRAAPWAYLPVEVTERERVWGLR